jgi:hypothetical protein
MSNMAAELVLMRAQREVSLVDQQTPSGGATALTAVLLATALVPLFMALGGCSDAKTAVEFGEFPTVRWPVMTDAEQWARHARVADDPWLLFVLPLGPHSRVRRFWAVGLISMAWNWLLFAPAPTAALFVLRYGYGVKTVHVLPFALAKALYAALIAPLVFVPVFLRTASSSVAPLHAHLSQDVIDVSLEPPPTALADPIVPDAAAELGAARAVSLATTTGVDVPAF